MSTLRALLKLLVPTVLALIVLVGQALPASACGSLLAPNGAIRLARASTLVAWHDGVERYMTSFTYQGDVTNLGWIVPLPTVPDKIEEGGGWTLQRLVRETHPVPVDDRVFAGAAGTPSQAQVLQQVRVQALDITVVKGSGEEIINWATGNGFYLSDETRGHLLGYAKGSSIFMAAKYDTAAAKARGQLSGDGAPVLITMRTAHPWIPLEVLALEGQQVQADLYLLTDEPLFTTDLGATIGQSSVGAEVPGAPGFRMAFQERMNPALYHDLSTDKNMGWVRSDGWLTYMSLDAPEPAVTYDMGVSATGVIRIAPYGTPPMEVVDRTPSPAVPVRLPLGTPEVALALTLVLAVGVASFFLLLRPRRRLPAQR